MSPPCGLLSSFCSTQSPYQRCVPSLLANEPVSKLSRTLAAACVVTMELGVICLMPRGGEHARVLGVGELGFDGVDDAEARDDFAAGGGHGLGRRVGALRLDDVAVRRRRRRPRASAGVLDVAAEHDTSIANDRRSQDSSGRLYYTSTSSTTRPFSGPSPLSRTAPLEAGDGNFRACVCDAALGQSVTGV